MKVAIIGSRSFQDYKLLQETLQPYKSKIKLIISGGAKGADILGEQYADENKIKKLIFPADWEKYGKSAGFRRNVDIVKNCDCVIAFWDGFSSGTAHSISLCEQFNKPYRIIEFK